MILRALVLATSSLIPYAGLAAAHPLPVTSVQTKVTARVLEATHHASSRHHLASFTIRAYSHNRPAAHEPVTFYIGVMKPGSGVPPTTWISSRSPQAKKYIVRSSRFTNHWGKAQLVLKGQTSQTMEMIAVKAGNFSSYDKTANRALAAMDAWWTTPSASPHANFADTVTVYPFMAHTSQSSNNLRVVTRHDGNVVSGVTIHNFVNPGTSQASSQTGMTNADGLANFSIPMGTNGSVVAVKSFGPMTSNPFAGGAIAYFAPK